MTDYTNNPDDSSSPQEDKGDNDPPAEQSGEVFHTEYGSNESPSGAIVMAVSAVEGVEPAEVEPLYESINPTALDTLMDGPVVIGDGGTIVVEFQYSGHRVSVRNNRSITILEDE